MMQLCGHVAMPEEVDRFKLTLEIPNYQTPAPDRTKDVYLYDIYRQIAGADDLGVQAIGDCVSWGFAHLVNFAQAIEIWQQLQQLSKTMDPEFKLKRDILLYEFQMMCTEYIYGISRVQVGGGRIRGDGSNGSWAAEGLKQFGGISRLHLKSLSVTPDYSGSRARSWGASGPPQNIIDAAKPHNVETITQVTSFNEAAWFIQNGYGVAVCSNVGFQNGRNGETARDAQGFAQRRGTWNHCMYFSGVRWDRPGLCLINQWPLEAFSGTLDKGQPKNSMWVEPTTCDEMLGQGDSWTISPFKGYPARQLTYRI